MLRTYAACSGSECEVISGDVMCTYARTYAKGIKEFLCLQNNILFII
jgi:hypothetical protein